jgi:hypothetical protein
VWNRYFFKKHYLTEILAMNKQNLKMISMLLGTAALFVVSASVLAVDGVVLITQSSAIAGNVTPGDAPGFPVTISKSGSYRLASNLTLPADKNTNGIEIGVANTSDVIVITLDLNGFQIIGPCPRPDGSGSCDRDSPRGTGKGVKAMGGYTGGDILNGTIMNMPSDGVNLQANSRLEKLKLVSNGGNGATVGRGTMVIQSNIGGNWGHGIYGTSSGLGRGSIIGNIITFNGHPADNAHGIPRAGAGIIDISSEGGIIVIDNAITDNYSFGINAEANADLGYGRNVITGNNNRGSQVSGGTDTGGNHQ